MGGWVSYALSFYFVAGAPAHGWLFFVLCLCFLVVRGLLTLCRTAVTVSATVGEEPLGFLWRGSFQVIERELICKDCTTMSINIRNFLLSIFIGNDPDMEGGRLALFFIVSVILRRIFRFER